MPDSPWWTTISARQLLVLRSRLLDRLSDEFRTIPAAELEDLVQRAFVVLFLRRQAVDPADDGLYRYLRTVAHNLALDWLKTTQWRRRQLPRAARERRKQPPENTKSGSTPVTPAEKREENELFWQIFCALGDLDRLVLWSHVVEGKSIREIARELDLDWHHVAASIRDVLRRIRGEFMP